MEALPIGETLAATYGRLRRPMTYATAIILLLVLPVFIVDGETGASSARSPSRSRWRSWRPWSSCLTVTPALAALLLREPTQLQQARRDPLGIRYRQLLGCCRRSSSPSAGGRSSSPESSSGGALVAIPQLPLGDAPVPGARPADRRGGRARDVADRDGAHRRPSHRRAAGRSRRPRAWPVIWAGP